MFSIRAKLIVSILAVATTAVVGMLMIGQWSFGRNFMAYLDSRDAQVLGQLNRALAGHYAEHKNWRRFVDNRPAWRQFTHQHLFFPTSPSLRIGAAALSAPPAGASPRPNTPTPVTQNLTDNRPMLRANLALRVSLQDRSGHPVVGVPSIREGVFAPADYER